MISAPGHTDIALECAATPSYLHKSTGPTVILHWLLQLLNPLEGVPSPSDDELRKMADASKGGRIDRKRRLFDLLDETYKFSPPRWMVQREFRKIWRALKADRNSWNIDLAGVGGDEHRLKLQYRAIAHRRVRLGLIIGVIARRLNITGVNYAREHRAKEVETQVVDFIFGLAN